MRSAFATAKHWLCRFGIHWHRQRALNVGAPWFSKVKCLDCCKEWEECGW